MMCRCTEAAERPTATQLVQDLGRMLTALRDRASAQMAAAAAAREPQQATAS